MVGSRIAAIVILSLLIPTALAAKSEVDAAGDVSAEASDSVKDLMPYRFLGRTGLKVSLLSFGTWVTFANQLSVDEACELLFESYRNGVNFFDHAEAYADGAAEQVSGECIQRGLDNGMWQRSDLVISTKIFWAGKGPNDRGLSRKRISEGLMKSLERLQLEYVDILFAHRPDPDTPMEETVRTMNFLMDQGLVFYWGTSEWTAEQIRHASGVAERLNLVGPIVEQPEYNMLHRERFEVEYAPLYKDIGLGTTIWSPLASGLLTNKYRDGIPPGSRFDTEKKLAKRYIENERHGNWDVVLSRVDTVASIADRIGCSPAQLSIAWCMKNPHVSTVILGATKLSQLKDNFGSLRCLEKVTDEVMAEIADAVQSSPTQPINFRNW